MSCDLGEATEGLENDCDLGEATEGLENEAEPHIYILSQK